MSLGAMYGGGGLQKGGTGTCASCPIKETSPGASIPATQIGTNDLPVEACCATEKRSPGALQALAKAASQVHGKRSRCSGLHLSPVIIGVLTFATCYH